MIRLEMEFPQVEAFGQAMSDAGINNDAVTAALKKVFGKAGTAGKAILKRYTAMHWGVLEDSVEKKYDRTRDRKAVWGMVGYQRLQGATRYQYAYVSGTVERYTRRGAYRGRWLGEHPHPFEITKELMQPKVTGIIRDFGDEYIVKAWAATGRKMEKLVRKVGRLK